MARLAGAGHPARSRCGRARLDDWRSMATTRSWSASHIIRSRGGGAYIGVVGQRVQGKFGEEFWVLDILEIVFSECTVRIPVFQQDMGPVGGVGVFEEQEGLPTQRSTAGHAGTIGTVELDGALQVCEAGALLECLAPARLGLVEGPHRDESMTGRRRHGTVRSR